MTKRKATQAIKEGGTGAELADGTDVRLDLPVARIKAIAKQDQDVGGLTKDAVERINAMTLDLLRELIHGAKLEATRRSKAKAGQTVIVTPEDIRSHILSSKRLSFLHAIAETSKESGFLEGYRARTQAAVKATSKRREGAGSSSIKALVGLGIEDEDEEEDADDPFVREGDEGDEEQERKRKGPTKLTLDEDYEDDD